MNYRVDRPGVAAGAMRSVPAVGSPHRSVASHGDAILGTVALGAMGLILAWVVTGIDLLAIVALLIVLAYFRLAGTLKSPASASGEVDPLDSAVNAGGESRSGRAPRRSAYEGIAD
jgi:hypothetical protein